MSGLSEFERLFLAYAILAVIAVILGYYAWIWLRSCGGYREFRGGRWGEIEINNNYRRWYREPYLPKGGVPTGRIHETASYLRKLKSASG